MSFSDPVSLRTARSRILLAWELGSGLGHVQALRHLAHALTSAGWEPVLALRNLVDSWPLLRNDTFRLLQAPYWLGCHGSAEEFRARSYTDLLAWHGFDSVDHLTPLVQAWDQLLAWVDPVLVVAHFSPTLILAASGRYPVAMVGNGFMVPPTHEATFPLLQANVAPWVPEAQVLMVIQELQQRRGRPVPRHVPELFAATERWLTVLPHLDPYVAVRRERYLGPLEALPGVLPPAPDHYFAYLSCAIQSTEPVLAALADANLPGTAYLRDSSVSLHVSLSRPHLHLLQQPAAVTTILEKSALVIHHGGGGLCQMSLAAGRPQLLFPTNLEQALNAQRLVAQGVALALIDQFTTADVCRCARQLLHHSAFTHRAREIGSALAQSTQPDAGTWIVSRCATLLPRTSPTGND